MDIDVPFPDVESDGSEGGDDVRCQRGIVPLSSAEIQTVLARRRLRGDAEGNELTINTSHSFPEGESLPSTPVSVESMEIRAKAQMMSSWHSDGHDYN